MSGTISITQFPLPPNNHQVGIDFITAGPDGNVWYTSTARLTIGRVTTDGQITEFPIPVDGNHSSDPYEQSAYSIVTGGDGNLWFALYHRKRLGRITPRGEITILPTLGHQTHPLYLALGHDGNIWYSSQPYVGGAVGTYADRIGRVTPEGMVREFLLPFGPEVTSMPYGITAGPDGNIWFAESYSEMIGRITPDGVLTQFPVPGSPQWITAGGDGNLWFTQQALGVPEIGRITVDGIVTRFPTPGAEPVSQITVGPDGNLWFAKFQGLVRVRPDGITTVFALASFTYSVITTGPDGNLWLSDPGANHVTRIVLK
jgi:streptogramin lyase